MKPHTADDRALYQRRTNPPTGEEDAVTAEIYAVARALRELRPANSAQAKREERTVELAEFESSHRSGCRRAFVWRAR